MAKKASSIDKIAAKQLKTQVMGLSESELSAAIKRLGHTSVPQWQAKTRAIFEGLSQVDRIADAASHLSALQLAVIVGPQGRPNKQIRSKLPSIMAGVTKETFQEFIIAANLKQLGVLKSEALADPVQHLLTVTTQQMLVSEAEITQEIDAIREEIGSVEASTFSLTTHRAIEARLGAVSTHIAEATAAIDRALGLAWASGRGDLVDTLSELKEYYRNDLRVGIGHPKSAEDTATGLYLAITQTLDLVYSGLTDDQPAAEALACLGIWHLGTFEELGLISGLSSAQKASIAAMHDCQAGSSEVDQICSRALEALADAGLGSIGDFRSNGIYSQEMLAEYLTTVPTLA